MATTPLNSNRTREPWPSTVFAPAALKRDSMRAHSNVAGVGRENIAASVPSCLLFMVLHHDTAQEKLATAIHIADP